MIAPLRRRHRWLTGILFLAVPGLLLLALRSRVAPVKIPALPADLAHDLPASGSESELLAIPALSDLNIVVRTGNKDGVATLEVSALKPLAQPDVLLYWAASEASEKLPEDPLLLGAFSDQGRVYVVPEAAAVQEGFLVFYSLAHQKVVASGALPPLLEPLPGLESIAEGLPS